MNIFLSAFSTLDFIAVALLLVCWQGIGLIIDNAVAGRPSTQNIMASYRRRWMEEMVTRDPRIFDSNVLGILRQGTSFFASGCIIAIGGCVALLDRTAQIEAIISDLGQPTTAPPVVWDTKILLLVLILAIAFLKFVWANRLFGYCAVVMAATPNDPTDENAAKTGLQAADIANCAARAFNRGLRSVYFALAAVAWLIGPWFLLASTALTLFVIARREFASETRRIILR